MTDISSIADHLQDEQVAFGVHASFNHRVREASKLQNIGVFVVCNMSSAVARDFPARVASSGEPGAGRERPAASGTVLFLFSFRVWTTRPPPLCAGLLPSVS